MWLVLTSTFATRRGVFMGGVSRFVFLFFFVGWGLLALVVWVSCVAAVAWVLVVMFLFLFCVVFLEVYFWWCCFGADWVDL